MLCRVAHLATCVVLWCLAVSCALSTRQTPLPTIATPASKGSWEVTVSDYKPLGEVLGIEPVLRPVVERVAQVRGRPVAVRFRARNLGNQPANVSMSDIQIESGDAR